MSNDLQPEDIRLLAEADALFRKLAPITEGSDERVVQMAACALAACAVVRAEIGEMPDKLVNDAVDILMNELVRYRQQLRHRN